MSREEALDSREFRLVQPDAASVAPNERDAAPAPDPVASVVADDGAGGGRDDHEGDVELPARGECCRRNERRLAGKRHTEALDAYEQEEEDVSIRPDEICDSVHGRRRRDQQGRKANGKPRAW